MSTIGPVQRSRAASDQTAVRSSRETFLVNIPRGMHLRPCALLVKTVRPYRSSVEVETEGRRVSGRSILDLLSLGAHYGSKMTFIITGEDASRAMVAVQRLFDRHFADAYRSVPAPVEAVPIAHSHR